MKKFLYSIFQLLPIKNKYVLFFSYYGSQYGGNPKYLSEYFSKHSDFKIIWAFTKPSNYNLNNIKIIKYASIKYYYYLAISKFIITNYRMTQEFHKRDNQVYIQTWHGSLGLKMIEKDAEDTLPIHYIDMAKNDSNQLDVLLSGSLKSKQIFEKAFWYNGQILESGTPQCDIFFQYRPDILNKVNTFFNIQNKKMLLYAPTFRKDNRLDCYDIDYDRLIQVLEDKTNTEWAVLVRLHPHLLHSDYNVYSDKVLNATMYDDVQELLYGADIVITDYSALMFDYMYTKKPCFLYMSDYEQYTSKDRNLYFDIQELPFPKSYTNDKLINQINDFDNENYIKKIDEFLKTIHSYEDGNTCERVLKYILEDNE